MNVLPREKRIAVLRALVEGNSERAIERMCDVNRKTINRLAVEFGEGAQRLHDRMARALRCEEIEADECWSFCGVKEARVRPEHRAGSGEAYVFTALDKASRFIITWHVGKRDAASTNVFIADLRARLLVMPTIVTDGFAPYVAAVGAEFGPSVDMAQTVKNYRYKGRRDDDHRYEPPRGIEFITKRTVYGAPDLGTASTAYVERNNATLRHHVGRLRRLCYAFSKKIENHRAALALGYCYLNLCVIVRTIRVTPAMAVGVTSRVWDVEELHDAIAAEVAPVEKPKAQPLTHPAPPAEQTSRPLPGNRGFLRVLPGGATPPKGPSIVPAPGPRPAAPAAAAPAPLREAPRTWEQLDLFGSKPEQRAPGREDEKGPE